MSYSRREYDEELRQIQTSLTTAYNTVTKNGANVEKLVTVANTLLTIATARLNNTLEERDERKWP